MPNNQPELGWKAPQIQKITLNFTNQPLTFRFRSLGTSSGFFKASLLLINPDTLAVIFNESATLPYNANASLFCAAVQKIQSAYQIKNNTPNCEVKQLD